MTATSAQLRNAADAKTVLAKAFAGLAYQAQLDAVSEHFTREPVEDAEALEAMANKLLNKAWRPNQ